MYFVICGDGIREAGRQEWEESPCGIGVFGSEEWGGEMDLKEKFSISQGQERIFFCKLENYGAYLFGTFHIPVKGRERRHDSFSLYILEGKLVFIDDGTVVSNAIGRIARRQGWQNRDRADPLELFLYDFFMELIEDDILYLAKLEREIAGMEERVLKGDTDRCSYRMLGIKKEISRLYCYYSQMTDVGEALGGQYGDCRLFAERAKRLQQEAQSLREYAMQVQDVYQSEIEIRQNDIMKVLTVVTAVFLPLSLMVGWYGMNFRHMPELEWEYGYPVVAGASAAIAAVCLWIFKKKKFF